MVFPEQKTALSKLSAAKLDQNLIWPKTDISRVSSQTFPKAKLAKISSLELKFIFTRLKRATKK